jgi:hypothetical protein
MGESMENNKKLLSKLASYESRVDHLETEIIYLNKILIECGFTEGIATLKETVNEILIEQKNLS